MLRERLITSLVLALESIIDFLCKLMAKKKKDRKKITYMQVYKLLSSMLMPRDLYISDLLFETIDKNELRLTLTKFKTYKKRYVREYFDCDDFAFSLQGEIEQVYPDLAFGIVWFRKHAMNFFIDNNFNVHLVEPQNNKMKMLKKPKKATLVVL